MIYAYGIDPALMLEAGKIQNFRFWSQSFGIGQPRVMAQFPKANKWRSQVLRSLPASMGDIEKKRVDALISHLLGSGARRIGDQYDGNHSWLENAEREHGRVPFKAILGTENPRAHADVLVASPIADFESDHQDWDVERGITVTRQARDMATAVQSMLASCTEILFVDPHFTFSRARFTRPMCRFLGEMMVSRRAAMPARVEIISASNARDESGQKDLANRYLKPHLPPGITVRFRHIADLSAATEKIHNRYILTDIGGVQFGIGLDEGESLETDDLTLLSKSQYEKRWQQYATTAPIFSCDYEFDVV